LDPLRVKEHHLNLGVCIFIALLHVLLFFFNNGLYNSFDKPQNQGSQAGQYLACF
jgi:hypothetical protein